MDSGKWSEKASRMILVSKERLCGWTVRQVWLEKGRTHRQGQAKESQLSPECSRKSLSGPRKLPPATSGCQPDHRWRIWPKQH